MLVADGVRVEWRQVARGRESGGKKGSLPFKEFLVGVEGLECKSARAEVCVCVCVCVRARARARYLFV